MFEQPLTGRSKGLSLPPSGWALALLLAVYIFTGLTGHDPWKNDDAITIGIVHQMLGSGNWLQFNLAGRVYPDAPLYYWLAAGLSRLFHWLLPVHDAVRLASGVFTLLALTFILLAARELHGREQAPAAPLLLAGSIGFLFHAHEAQPMLAALTAHCGAYWALAKLDRDPRSGAVCFGAALGLGYLANGLAPMVLLLPVAAVAVWQSSDRAHASRHLLGSLLIAGLLGGLWSITLALSSREYLSAYWQSELNQLTAYPQPLLSLQRLLSMLPWYAWPALPLAGWTLWARRRQLAGPALRLPILSILIALLVVGLWLGSRSALALLLLPPLVLLAVPAIASLRRGAANAFDWFGMITFSVFALLGWLGWTAMIFGWPEHLTRQLLRLEPGFSTEFNWPATVAALSGTLAWVWLIATSPRSPMRGIMHWMSGLTLFWLLMATLWMPWWNYGKTYRAPALALSEVLPKSRDCIAEIDLSEAMLASLDYFSAIQTVPLRSNSGKNCDWLLTYGPAREHELVATVNWRKVWEGGRPVDRKDGEKLRLYRRAIKNARNPANK
ncbi:MAG TPA: glycosyltransferase family 39 protein [Accumulibacter sp.]|nr:glycosyltransferase family 39 protein [Accumulibacter sp.]HMW17492.1 glycosyltransferase family 39 protein [Accumulibacter sp.]HMY07403.1 glycosyltransferase family 39 protein [Accumulibacter sp.]HND80040.1 glycosyltransferase family 39 protein [Accumulibacter sp.]HNE12232.1 glycosyltransferase family 39 protein [Accumulibacter sp.]